MLVAAEEGIVDLDEPAGPPGATLRHLLAHASGLPFDPGAPVTRPGVYRVYSNYGFDVAVRRVDEPGHADGDVLARPTVDLAQSIHEPRD